MVRYLLPFLVFFSFLIEGTWFQIFVNTSSGEVEWVPRFTLLLVIFTSIYRGPGAGIILGLFAGALYDLTYTDLLGLYIFSFGLVAYLCSYPFRGIKSSLVLQLSVVIGALVIFEWMTYGIYYVTDYTNVVFADFFVWRLMPSLLLNTAAAALLYLPLQKLFIYIEKSEKIWQR